MYVSATAGVLNCHQLFNHVLPTIMLLLFCATCGKILWMVIFL